MKNLFTILCLVFLVVTQSYGRPIPRNTPPVIQDRLGVIFEPNQETPFTGKYVRVHGNHQKRIEGQYKDGLKTGLWKEWHRNGMKRFEGTYEEGKEVGSVIWWNKKGEKVDKEPRRFTPRFPLSRKLKEEREEKKRMVLEMFKIDR